MTSNERQQRVVERILEDESLRGDLEDRAASALIAWASDRAGAIAADPSRADAAVDAEVLVVRNAARLAAAAAESEPEQVVALAEAELKKQSLPASPTPQRAATHPATRPNTEQPAPATTLPPLFLPDLADRATPLEQRAHGAAQGQQSEQPSSAAALNAGKTGAQAAARGPASGAGEQAGAAIADASERIAAGAGGDRRAKRAAGKK